MGDAACFWDDGGDVHDDEGQPFAEKEDEGAEGGEAQDVFSAAADDLPFCAGEELRGVFMGVFFGLFAEGFGELGGLPHVRDARFVEVEVGAAGFP